MLVLLTNFVTAPAISSNSEIMLSDEAPKSVGCTALLTEKIYPVQLDQRIQRSMKVRAVNSDTYDQTFKGRIRAEVLPEFETIRQFPATGRLHPDAKLRVLAFHGSGMSYSHSDAMRQVMYLLGDMKEQYGRQSLAKKIRGLLEFTPISIEGIDFPKHGLGSRASNLNTKAELTEYFARYIRQVRAETPELKLVIFTRSSSAIFFFDLVDKYPDLIDAFVLMSPTVPVLEWMIPARKDLEAVAANSNGQIQVNKEGLDWVFSLLANSVWDKKSLKDKPTLILSGDSDPERNPGELEFFKMLAAEATNVKLFNIPNGRHDVFRTYSSKNPPVYSENDVLAVAQEVEKFFSQIASIPR